MTIIKKFREWIGLDPVRGRSFDRPEDELNYLRKVFEGKDTVDDYLHYKRKVMCDPDIEQFTSLVVMVVVWVLVMGFYAIAVIGTLQILHWIGLL